eukprot:2943656-Amphidinium_carterae.1
MEHLARDIFQKFDHGDCILSDYIEDIDSLLRLTKQASAVIVILSEGAVRLGSCPSQPARTCEKHIMMFPFAHFASRQTCAGQGLWHATGGKLLILRTVTGLIASGFRSGDSFS